MRAEPQGHWIPEANKPPSVLDQTREPGVVRGINYAYPITVHSLMPVEIDLYLAALQSSIAYSS